MGHRVFAYGTLMFPSIAHAVAGEAAPARSARLDDHARHALRDRAFPGAVPRPGSRIDGRVYEHLSAAALARIDAFEGNLYRREQVWVRVGEEGRACEALVYLLRPRWRALLLARDWSPEQFRRDWLHRYLEICGEASPQRRPTPGPTAIGRR